MQIDVLLVDMAVCIIMIQRLGVILLFQKIVLLVDSDNHCQSRGGFTRQSVVCLCPLSLCRAMQISCFVRRLCIKGHYWKIKKAFECVGY